MRRSSARAPRAACRGPATVALLLAAATAARAEPAPASPFLSSLGRLERESLEDGLAQLGLAIDPSPEGKRIGHVYVVNHEVFSRHDGLFQFLNVFHGTTRPDVLGRELLLAPGQRWDAALADESVRNLQAPPPYVANQIFPFASSMIL